MERRKKIVYEYKALVTNVVDGDTIDVDIDLGFYMVARVRMRLARVDTPETYGVSRDSDEYKAGMKSKEFVKERLIMQDVLIKTQKTGKFGRWIAEVFYGPNFEINLSDELIKRGLAEPYS